MNYKEYLYSLKSYISFSALFFAMSVIYGYIIAQSEPDQAKMLLREFEQIYGPILQFPSFWQFILIFLNNSLSLVLTLLLGVVFGIIPALALFSNGALLGIFAFFAGQQSAWLELIVGLLPHGIIEIPVLILTGAMGLKIGKTAYLRVFKKQGGARPALSNFERKGGVKQEISLAFSFFIKILLPFLALAAAIEIFITGRLLGI